MIPAPVPSRAAFITFIHGCLPNFLQLNSDNTWVQTVQISHSKNLKLYTIWFCNLTLQESWCHQHKETQKNCLLSSYISEIRLFLSTKHLDTLIHSIHTYQYFAISAKYTLSINLIALLCVFFIIIYYIFLSATSSVPWFMLTEQSWDVDTKFRFLQSFNRAEQFQPGNHSLDVRSILMCHVFIDTVSRVFMSSIPNVSFNIQF